MMAEKPVDFEELPSVVANRVYFKNSVYFGNNMEYDFMRKIKFRDSDDLLKQVSKIVSYILRHGGEEARIRMDEQKQVEVIDLFEICRQSCGISSYADFVAMLKASNDKKRRYAFVDTEDGKLLIKAVHKFEVLPGTNTKIQAVKDTKWLPSTGGFRAGRSDKSARARMFQVLRSDHFEMVIVRKGMNLDSGQVGCLQRLEIVELLGEPIVISDGIVRIKVKSIESETCGWVTQDARQADGPQFLQEITETYWADVANNPDDEHEDPTMLPPNSNGYSNAYSSGYSNPPGDHGYNNGAGGGGGPHPQHHNGGGYHNQHYQNGGGGGGPGGPARGGGYDSYGPPSSDDRHYNSTDMYPDQGGSRGSPSTGYRYSKGGKRENAYYDPGKRGGSKGGGYNYNDGRPPRYGGGGGGGYHDPYSYSNASASGGKGSRNGSKGESGKNSGGGAPGDQQHPDYYSGKGSASGGKDQHKGNSKGGGGKASSGGKGGSSRDNYAYANAPGEEGGDHYNSRSSPSNQNSYSKSRNNWEQSEEYYGGNKSRENQNWWKNSHKSGSSRRGDREAGYYDQQQWDSNWSGGRRQEKKGDRGGKSESSSAGRKGERDYGDGASPGGEEQDQGGKNTESGGSRSKGNKKGEKKGDRDGSPTKGKNKGAPSGGASPTEAGAPAATENGATAVDGAATKGDGKADGKGKKNGGKSNKGRRDKNAAGGRGGTQESS